MEGGSSGGGGGRVGGGVRVDLIEELKFWGKFIKKKIWGGGGRGVGRGVGLGGQGGCERRIEFFAKTQKKKNGGWGRGRGGGGFGWGGGVRMDVNEEYKFL